MTNLPMIAIWRIPTPCLGRERNYVTAHHGIVCDSINNKNTPGAALSKLWQIYFLQLGGCPPSGAPTADRRTDATKSLLPLSFLCAPRIVYAGKTMVWPFLIRISPEECFILSSPLHSALSPLLVFPWIFEADSSEHIYSPRSSKAWTSAQNHTLMPNKRWWYEQKTAAWRGSAPLC